MRPARPSCLRHPAVLTNAEAQISCAFLYLQDVDVDPAEIELLRSRVLDLERKRSLEAERSLSSTDSLRLLVSCVS